MSLIMVSCLLGVLEMWLNLVKIPMKTCQIHMQGIVIQKKHLQE